MQVFYVSKIECLIGFLCSEFIFEKERDSSYESLFFQLLDFIFRDATLSHVTQSVTRNGKSIMLTMMLALILIYLFSLVGFVIFRDDFLANVQRNKYSIRHCLSHRFILYKSIIFLFSYLATTIPTIIENDYCTKDNCTNQTLTNLTHQSDEIGDEHVERACDTLFMCIVTTLNKGLRNGGGIGDVLRQPSSRVRILHINCA
jgi:hypothetical protein